MMIMKTGMESASRLWNREKWQQTVEMALYTNGCPLLMMTVKDDSKSY